MTADERVRVVVSGSVQGVFFRAGAREIARRLGLSGWVRNRADGRVEAEFQGQEAAVERAVAFCRSGPRHAWVTRVDVRPVETVDGDRGFEVR